MKYSLANKEFKKRNNIFGERRQDNAVQEVGEQHLDEIKELGQELEDSKIQQESLKDSNKNTKKIGDIFKGSQVTTPKIQSQQLLKKSGQHRVGRHGLSPNTKPSVPLIRTSTKSIIGIRSLTVPRRPLMLCSKTTQFQYYSQETQIQLAETRQLLLKLYIILSKNNERIAELQALTVLLSNRNNAIIHELQFSLGYALQLQRKVDLFLNTMRNVYQNLRISKLKQENLELFLKQNQSTDRRQQSDKKKNHINSGKKQRSVREVQELMSLLEYESDNSVVEPYLQKQQMEKQTPRQLQPFRSIYYEQESMRGQSKTNHQQSTNLQYYPPKETFRIEQTHFQRLSPFQANRLMSSPPQSSHSFKKPQADPPSHPHDKQSSPRSNWSYSFEASECEKIRVWLKKRGQEGLVCWLDQLGCLRRPNMTYVFWPSGEVMRLSPSSFQQLQSEGAIRQHRGQ